LIFTTYLREKNLKTGMVKPTCLSRNADTYTFLKLTPEKNDICISIVVVNGADTGKVYVI
jgi:hypothetical protein